nr:MAG TPA: hypothetical protein [Caudoviricetes sp.]
MPGLSGFLPPQGGDCWPGSHFLPKGSAVP